MSDKIYTNKELIDKYRQCPEVIFKMWQESEFQKVSYQKEIIILKKSLAYWRKEAEKFEKLSNEKLRKKIINKISNYPFDVAERTRKIIEENKALFENLAKE